MQNSNLIYKNPIKKHFKHQLPLSQPWWSSATQLLLLKLMPGIVLPSQNTWLPQNDEPKETSQSPHKKSLETGPAKDKTINIKGIKETLLVPGIDMGMIIVSINMTFTTFSKEARRSTVKASDWTAPQSNTTCHHRNCLIITIARTPFRQFHTTEHNANWLHIISW
jgi:hypothetical protein